MDRRYAERQRPRCHLFAFGQLGDRLWCMHITGVGVLEQGQSGVH